MPSTPTFEVVAKGEPPGKQLLFGVSHLGMAGVTAADYLVRHLDFDAIGRIRARGIPSIAPFEDGEVRQPMRLYASEAEDLTVVVCESFIPVDAAEAFVDGFLDWVTETDIEELSLLYGVPFPHAPRQHQVFYAATPEFRESNLQDGDVEPLAGGFLDGVVAEIVLRSLEGDAPPAGAFVTPSHPPGPDVDAALLLLQTVETICDLAVDEDELRETAEQRRRYYSELANRIEALGEGEQPLGSRDYPEDRMFM